MGTRDPLGHSFQLLRWMAEQEDSHFGVRRIAAALGVEPSTVSRLLARLAAERVVKRDPVTGEYALGLEVIRLGLLASRKLDVKRVARPHLERITAACNETSILGLYDATRMEMLRVDKVDSSHPLNYTIRMDEWTEIYRGASGLGILAFLPPDEREAVLAMADAAASEAEPWLKRDELDKYLAEIRQRGYASTHGRRLAGAVAVSAPIVGMEGTVIGDVILTVPDVRWSLHEESELARLVMDAAAAVSRDIGGTDADLALVRSR